jgi:hypothetical protein
MLRILGVHPNPGVRILLAAALIAIGVGAQLPALAVIGAVLLVWSVVQVVIDRRDDRTDVHPR